MAWLETIADRFQLHERAGAGGMGVVRRGVDLGSGQPVAVKLLHSGQGADRFLREAELLAKLDHPAIVRYVAHGATELGRLYIVMQWLDGGTLGELLTARSSLSPREVVTLGKRLAAGLAAAHAQGVVHRDIKPSNVILPENALDRATLIDFGVARRALDPRLTAIGMLIGTASYMSPEQARGEREIEATTDVFSMGSLLYRAITGKHPFQAGDATATLAKVLLDEPAPVSELAPKAPGALADLIHQMLSKEPAHRPASGAELLERFDALERLETPQNPSVPPAALGTEEQRVVWVIVLGAARDLESTTRDGPAQGVTETANPAEIAAKYGARWDTLADGAGVASLFGHSADRGERATGLAREISLAYPERAMALAMGLGLVERRAPVGHALDCAVKELARATPGEVRIDADTARSLEPADVVLLGDGGYRLENTTKRSDETRRLLGKVTRCVGRERELVTLEALADECFGDGVARAALVLGPTGAGKSRLRYEFLNRIRERHRPEIMLGRADSLSAGSPFGLLREALRRHTRILDGEPLADGREKIRAHVTRLLGETTRAFDVAVFLGELAHVPFDDADSDLLRLSRADPARMGDAIRSAWLDYLAAEGRERPLLLVLEDLHWGDRATTALIDAALSEHAERALMIVALARPEIADSMPDLWSKRELTLLRLTPLHKAACGELVHDVLGDSVDAELQSRVIDLSDGNAFFLEELIRAVSEGKTELPPTVMGIVQARLDALDPESRRLLRAASVFGERFWRGGLEKLLGEHEEGPDLDRSLAELETRELLSRRAEAAFPGEVEYVFRHSIVRETAYAALTEADRALAHRIAGTWLERAGESDALMLAEHFRRAGLRERAARFFLASAERALEGQDLPACVERAELALECEPDRATRGQVAEVLAHAKLWLGDYAAAESMSREAVSLLEHASPRWFAALSEAVSSSGALDHAEVMTEVAELAENAEAKSDDARAAQVMCLSRAATGHLRHGRREAALRTLERIDRIRSEATTLGAAIEAWAHHGRASLAYFSGESAEFRSALEAAISAYDAAGDRRAATNDRVNLGFALAALGDYARAEELIERAAQQAERLGLAKVSGFAWHNLGWIRMQTGAYAEAVALQRKAIEVAGSQREALLEGSARAYLSLALSADGQGRVAESEARRATELLEPVPAVRPHALAALARALLSQAKYADALAPAEEALAGAESTDLPEDSDALVRLVAAEARGANDELDKAGDTLRSSCERILARAERVGDPELRRSFLERVPEHARTFELSRAFPRRTDKIQ